MTEPWRSLVLEWHGRESLCLSEQLSRTIYVSKKQTSIGSICYNSLVHTINTGCKYSPTNINIQRWILIILRSPDSLKSLIIWVQDLIPLTSVFLKVLSSHMHRNSSTHPYPPVSPKNPLCFYKVNKGQQLLTLPQGYGLGADRVRDMLWTPQRQVPSKAPPGQSCPLGSAQVELIGSRWSQVVLNGIAQGKGKDNQMIVLLRHPYQGEGWGERVWGDIR